MAEKNLKNPKPFNEGSSKGNIRNIPSSGRQAPPPPKPTPSKPKK